MALNLTRLHKEQPALLAVLLVGTMFLVSVAWEFLLEEPVSAYFGWPFDEATEITERWHFIFAATLFAALSLIVPIAFLRRALNSLAFYRDKLEHAVAERTTELAFSNDLIRNEIESSPDAILVVDASGRMASFNQRFLDMWHIPPEVARTRDDNAALASVLGLLKHPDEFLAGVRYLYAHHDETVRDEIALNDGRILDRYSAGMHDTEKNYLGRVWFFRDITERKKAAADLEFANNLLTTQIETSPDGILVIDANRKVVLFNSRFAEMWKIPPEIVAAGLGEAILKACTPQVKDPEKFYARVTELYDNPDEIASEDIEFTDGRVFDRHSRPLRDSAGKYLGRVWIFHDITERKRAEEAMQNQLTLLATVMDNATEAIFLCAAGARVTFMNRAAERMFGYRQEELLGQVLHDALHHHYPDGSPYPITECPFFRVFTHLETQTNREDKWIRCDGTFIDVSISNAPIIEGGRAVGAVLAMHDITERKRAEEALRQSEVQLREAQKMEAVGQLTGGVAHDFNNLLTVVIGNLELILERGRTDPALRKWARSALDGSLRGAQLTQRLLAFSRQQQLQPTVTNLADRLPDMSALLRQSLGEHINVVIDISPDLWPVMADASQLDDSLLNLALNARDAMPSGGTLTIEATNVALDEDFAARNIEISPGDYVRLTVRDTGSGMPPEVVDRAFEPFFTTKEVGKGSGLGLSMVYGFVKQSNGQINIDSEVGRGTIVEIFLPRASMTEPAEAAPKLEIANLSANGELVLVVEDNESVRDVVVTQLAEMGYRTLQAEAAETALILLRARPDIDLMFTDVVMRGGMNGYELAREARARHPGLKILLTSGFTTRTVTDGHQDTAGFELLKKPYRKDDLARKLRQTLTPEQSCVG